MKFKKLEVSGFKSFADKLEVKFGSGITGIVGPNGCGKSNVADSIRWVLGEQSAKLLRGHSMQDVIFNGTENRKSLSFCEVSLVFDNTEDENGEKLFRNLDYKEVVISRKLYRSGESEYLINRQTCRLRDISELLRDGGMGREGYSIIGQGRIDELLLAKPEDRRAIFEEAAGISKFKVKKVESERKLNRTNDNISRLTDILDEKAKQLEPLTRQSENARKWLAFRDELKHYEINTYIHQYDFASEAKAVINDRLNGVLEELDNKNKESENATIAYNEAMANMLNADNKSNALRDELTDLKVGIEKHAGDIRVSNERRLYLIKENERLNGEREKLTQDHSQTMQMVEAGEVTLDEKKVQLQELNDTLTRVTDEYFAVVTKLTANENEADEHHNKVYKAMEKLSEIKSNMSRLLAEKDGLMSKIYDLDMRITGLNELNETSGSGKEALDKEIKELVAQKNELVGEREKLYELNNNALATINICANKLDKLSAEFHTKNTRLKMFKEMQESNESFAFSVKKLISESKQNSELASKIEGVVASLIKVESGYETAIETALGNAVQNIVTKSEQEAKFLINYLKQKRYGIATFLPINAVKPRVIDGRYLSMINKNGNRGCAVDYIKFDAKYEPVMRSLLGATIISSDLDSAIALSRECHRNLKIVTLDGDVISPNGPMTGGSKRSQLTNIFGYENEITTLTAEIDKMKVEIDALNAERDECAKNQSASVKSISTLSEDIHKIDVVLAGKTESKLQLEQEFMREKHELETLVGDMDSARARVKAIDDDINSVSELENIVKSENTLSAEVRDEQQQVFEKLRSERDGLNDKMINARIAVSELDGDIKNFMSDIARLKSTSLSLVDSIEIASLRLAENTEIIEKIDADLNAFTHTSQDSDTARVKEIRACLADFEVFKSEISEKLAQMERERSQILELIQLLHEKKTKEELQLARVDSELEQMQIRIAEMYDLEYSQCLPFKEEGYNAVEGEKIASKIRVKMKFLGNVNIDAIEQCKEVYESYHDLDVQREDLLKAKADLEKMIAELSKEMLERFTGEFEQIRKNFVKIFKELFSGGNADLILLENENPLNAGIEIFAQPPEKKLQSISLLSGGERALTAIAILFAILKLRPMPFCVLDEIEAALDDANAGRFAKYLRRFSEGTQFIVITHRKPTMELADSLYGVTMEEKGVSKIVSVKLGEAVAVADQAK